MLLLFLIYHWFMSPLFVFSNSENWFWRKISCVILFKFLIFLKVIESWRRNISLIPIWNDLSFCFVTIRTNILNCFCLSCIRTHLSRTYIDSGIFIGRMLLTRSLWLVDKHDFLWVSFAWPMSRCVNWEQCLFTFFSIKILCVIPSMIILWLISLWQNFILLFQSCFILQLNVFFMPLNKFFSYLVSIELVPILFKFRSFFLVHNIFQYNFASLLIFVQSFLLYERFNLLWSWLINPCFAPQLRIRAFLWIFKWTYRWSLCRQIFGNKFGVFTFSHITKNLYLFNIKARLITFILKHFSFNLSTFNSFLAFYFMINMVLLL